MFNFLKPKQIGFFDLFDKQAATVQLTVNRLHETLTKLGTSEVDELIARVEELEHECDTIAHMTVDLLRRSFVTPFEREEIRTLVSHLDDVADLAEAAAHRITLYRIVEVPAGVIELCEVMVKAQTEVVALVSMLRDLKHNDEQAFQTRFKEINRLENVGDRLHRTGIADLFRDGRDALEVIKCKEMYEILESAVDACEDVAHVIEGIIIEHHS